MAGSAVLTTVESRFCMNNATAMMIAVRRMRDSDISGSASAVGLAGESLSAMSV
jgi:hypothetical protein